VGERPTAGGGGADDSVFYGIVITMNYREHGPPHLHARYGEHRSVFGIDPVRVMRGRLPRRAENIVSEWTSLHRDELIDNWARARADRSLVRIAPLD
jgi:hypothetical protein